MSRKLGYRHTEETKVKIGLANKGLKKPHTKEWRKQMSIFRKGRPFSEKVCQERKEKYKDIRFKEYVESKALANRRMNKYELEVNSILETWFPGEWKWVGNGAFWIEGKNPDFLNESKKIVIEVIGNEFWRRKVQKDWFGRINLFKKNGFKTVIISKKNLESPVRLRKFILLESY